MHPLKATRDERRAARLAPLDTFIGTTIDYVLHDAQQAAFDVVYSDDQKRTRARRLRNDRLGRQNRREQRRRAVAAWKQRREYEAAWRAEQVRRQALIAEQQERNREYWQHKESEEARALFAAVGPLVAERGVAFARLYPENDTRLMEFCRSSLLSARFVESRGEFYIYEIRPFGFEGPWTHQTGVKP